MDQVGPLTDQRGKGERGGWRLTGRSQLFVDPLMGPVDTRFQPFQKLVLLVHPEAMKTSRPLGHVFQQALHRGTACQLSPAVPAHPIRHHEEVCRRLPHPAGQQAVLQAGLTQVHRLPQRRDDEVVFVVLPHLAGIGQAEGIHAHEGALPCRTASRAIQANAASTPAPVLALVVNWCQDLSARALSSAFPSFHSSVRSDLLRATAEGSGPTAFSTMSRSSNTWSKVSRRVPSTT